MLVVSPKLRPAIPHRLFSAPAGSSTTWQGESAVEVDTEPLLPVASSRTTPTPLDPGYGRSGTIDHRWNVIVAEYPDEESS